MVRSDRKIVSSRLAGGTQGDPVSKDKAKTNKTDKTKVLMFVIWAEKALGLLAGLSA